MEIKQFLLNLISPKTGVSSKRVSGLLGWITCLLVCIYCTINVIQAPIIIDTIVWASMILLGVDSVTEIWKKRN
jgi:hypothetical protein